MTKITRSIESIKLRAIKRGVSFKEQFIKDSLAKNKDKDIINNKKIEIKVKKDENFISKRRNEIIEIGELRPNIINKDKYWHCLSCNNDNFLFRTNCNRCMRNRIIEKLIISNKSKNDSTIVQNPSWNIKQLSIEEINENNRLRLLLQNEIDTGVISDMTADERERANILLERSKRKKLKKELIKKGEIKL